MGYVEDLHVRCEVPYTPGDLFRQQKRWAYGVMRAFMAHGPKIFLICGVLLRWRLDPFSRKQPTSQ